MVALKEVFARLFSRTFFYPTLIFNLLKRSNHRRWYDRIDNTVILGALPIRNYIDELHAQHNVRGIVTLNESYELRYTIPSMEQLAERDIEQIMLPTVDFWRAPTQSDIHRGIEFIKRFRDKGHSVYVHCKAGRGRSTTVVACYLMSEGSMTPEAALEFMRARRPHVRLCRDQFNAINEFYETNLIRTN